jgi:hypothetical protein
LKGVLYYYAMLLLTIMVYDAPTPLQQAAPTIFVLYEVGPVTSSHPAGHT